MNSYHLKSMWVSYKENSSLNGNDKLIVNRVVEEISFKFHQRKELGQFFFIFFFNFKKINFIFVEVTK